MVNRNKVNNGLASYEPCFGKHEVIAKIITKNCNEYPLKQLCNRLNT